MLDKKGLWNEAPDGGQWLLVYEIAEWISAA